jgi:UPF0271 protein
MAPVVDLNSDLGEGFGRWALGDDRALLGIVTSANVACGFHAGDPSTLRRVTRWAAEAGVAVGAQVSYRDLAGFGRRAMEVPADELRDEILYQIGALEAFCRAAGDRLRYVKPHGALYNRCATDPVQAGAVVGAVVDHGAGLPILALPGSALLEAAAAAGLATVAEGFADRAYEPDGTLVPRSQPGAVLTAPDEVVARALALATGQPIVAAGGERVSIRARSLCVHGDTPGAVALAAAVRRALEEAGVELAAFAP